MLIQNKKFKKKEKFKKKKLQLGNRVNFMVDDFKLFTRIFSFMNLTKQYSSG